MAIILLTLMNLFFVQSFIWKWSKLCFVYVHWTVASVSTTRVPPLHTIPPSPHPLPPSPLVSTPRPLTCRTSKYPADDMQMAHPSLANATSQLHAASTSVIPTSHTRCATHLHCCTGLSLVDSPCFLHASDSVRPRPLLFLTFADHHILLCLKFAGGSLTAPQPPQSLTLHTSEALNHPVCSIGTQPLYPWCSISDMQQLTVVLVAMWKQQGKGGAQHCVNHCWWRGQHPARALGVACGYSGGACQVGGVGHTMRSRRHCLNIHNFDTNATS